MHRATIGFERSAGAYERGRPEYPPEAAHALLHHCRVDQDTRVLELGAGTGKFTGFIREQSQHLVASDPSQAMRAALRQKFPDVLCVAARADHIPMATGSVRAVICAQAFHWFADPPSVAEITRVLAPGGRLGLLWNVRDESVAWIAALTGLIDVHSGDAPRYKTGAWKRAIAEHASLGELQSETHRHVVVCDRPTVLDRVGSISFIAALPEPRYREVLAQVGDLLDSHPETRGRTLFEFPYRTDLYWCERRI